MSTIKFETPIEYSQDFSGIVSNNTLITKSYATTTIVNQVATSGTSGWATSAANSHTLNSNNASFYLDRTNHTGVQVASTISNFNTTVLSLAQSGTSGFASNANFAYKTAKTLNFSIRSSDGNPITTGLKGYMLIPYGCTIRKWNIRAYPSATVTIDIWKRSQLHPTSSSFSITASAKPSVTSNEYATSSTLTGWTTTASEGDILAFNVDANNNATEIELVIQINM